MNIGIDIDGVIQNVYKFIIEAGTNYSKEHNKGELINPNTYYIQDMFNWDKDTTNLFWTENEFRYAKYGEVIGNASTNIKKLKKDGHNIYIITARDVVKNEDYSVRLNEMKNTVIEWLSKNDIKYDRIVFSGNSKEKDLIDNQINIMIEDSPKNLNELSKTTKMICFDWPYNKDVEGKNIVRCTNWNEIYEKICEINNEGIQIM